MDKKYIALSEGVEKIIDYRGKTPKKLGGDWVENGIRTISAKNVHDGVLDNIDSIRCVTEEIYEKWMKEKIQRNDIFIASEGASMGESMIWESDEQIVLGQRLFAVRVNPEVLNPFYLAMYMRTPEYRAELENHCTGTSVMGLSQPSLLKTKIRYIPIEKQNYIGAMYQSICGKIATNTEINNNLEQQARAIYQNLFENIDSLPAEWKRVSLGEVASISNKSFNPLKEPETLLEHYSIPAYDDTKFPVFELSTEIKSNKFIIDDSCFMISKLNPTTKRVWRPYCITDNAVCSTEFIVYKAKDESMTNYLYSVINSDAFSDFMCSHVTGSTGSRQRTAPKDTLFFEVIIPTEEELNTFQSTVAPMYAQMRDSAIENSKLKEIRDVLLPKLMSGEIDVSNI